MLYRVIESLYLWKSCRRIPAGTISNLAGIPPETIKALLAKRGIAEVQSAPLALIKGYEDREGSIADAIEAGHKELLPYIEASGPAKDYVTGTPLSSIGLGTDAMGCIVPEPVTELDDEGEYIPGGLSLEEVEKEDLQALDASFGVDDNEQSVG